MIGPVPAALDADWAETLAAIAREARLVPLDDPRFPELVAAMAKVYNVAPGELRASPREQLSARLGFWFPRDVPKSAGAVRELVALGRSACTRILDVGAGLGATHRGIVRALGGSGTVEVTAVDDDRDALRIAKTIAERRPTEGGAKLRLRTEEASFAELVRRPPRARFDVIALGQVLSELDLERTPDERLLLHADAIAALASAALEPNGVVVLVEPALRPRSRHLQRLRGALVERGLAIVAPCLHEGRCPLLGRENDWCHEDLPVDLPPFLAPIAKRAGLRWEGLTFSYLVVAPRPPRLVERLDAEARRERAVSSLLITKGKREVVFCGDPLRENVPEDDPYGAHGTRVGRLDRDRSDENALFDDLSRGDVVALGPLDEKVRLSHEATLRTLRVRG